jgi:F-type H+-transporting ATPase subunit b
MRGWVLFAVALLVLVVFAPAPLFAADEGPGQVADEAQKDMFARALDLGIWTLVVFLLLVFILSRTGWKWMLEGLARRETDIAAAVEDARIAREQAERLKLEIRAERQKAADEARQIHDEARRTAQAAAEEMIAKAKADIEADRARLRRELAIERDQALQMMWQQAAELATLISARAIRRQLNPDDHRVLLDEALADMRGAVAERRGASGDRA